MEKTFTVKPSRVFIQDIDELEPETALDIAKKLKILETAPLPIGKSQIKKLKGFTPPLYRLRVGDYRVLYRIIENEIILLKIVSRKELERELRKFH